METNFDDAICEKIIKYWFSGGSELWFQKNPVIRKLIDLHITTEFGNILSFLEDFYKDNSQELFVPDLNKTLTTIIILDQFSRHIYRDTNVDKIRQNTLMAMNVSRFFLTHHSRKFEMCELKYLAFFLMPFKHVDLHANWKFINDQLTLYDYRSCDVLYKFYKDSIRKYSLLENSRAISDSIRARSNNIKGAGEVADVEEVDAEDKLSGIFSSITDFLPPNFITIKEVFANALIGILNNNQQYQPKQCHPIFNTVVKFIEDLLSKESGAKKPIITISISGGVDSMVTTFVLALMAKKLGTFSLQAVHLNYLNRQVSTDEANFVVWYCNQLNIPIFLRTIHEIQRGDSKRVREKNSEDARDNSSGNRDFYETLTRKIRFDMYDKLPKSEGQKHSYVVLGHNHDDIVENIWTNFAKGNFIFNLKKMEQIDMQENVLILRPLLYIKKDIIYDFSTKFHIAYLKNTTPEWSVRGKMRNTFLPNVRDIFGNQVNVEFVADTLYEYGQYIDSTLFKSMLDRIVYTNAQENEESGDTSYCLIPFEKEHLNLGTHFWGTIFGSVLRKIGLSDPTRKSMDKFVHDLRKLYLNDKHQTKKINIKAGVCVTLNKHKSTLTIHIKK